MKRVRKTPISEASLQFSRNTKRLMDAKALTIEALSHATGISHGNIHRIANGEVEIPLKSAQALSKYFDRSLEEMVNKDVEI
jgi:plasmid maintenance system antidote protein VapI